MNDMLVFGLETALVCAPSVATGMLMVWALLVLVADLSRVWRRAALVAAGTAGGLRAYDAVEMLGPDANLAQIVTVILAMLMTALLFHGSGRLLMQTIAGNRARPGLLP